MGNELITEHDERIRSYFQALEHLSKALEIRKMGNELITEHDERIRSYFQALEHLSKALEMLFSKHKSSLDGVSFYTDEELSQRLKISRRSLQDYRNQGRIPYIKLGGKILYRSSDVERMLEEGYRNEFR